MVAAMAANIRVTSSFETWDERYEAIGRYKISTGNSVEPCVRCSLSAEIRTAPRIIPGRDKGHSWQFLAIPDCNKPSNAQAHYTSPSYWRPCQPSGQACPSTTWSCRSSTNRWLRPTSLIAKSPRRRTGRAAENRPRARCSTKPPWLPSWCWP